MRVQYYWALPAMLLLAFANADSPLTSSISASYEQEVGMLCQVDADCGYLPSLACIDGLCDYCRLSHEDCGDYPGDVSKRCQTLTLQNRETGVLEPQYAPNANGDVVEIAYCIEKDLFSPFSWNDAIGTLIAFASTALGSGCGIGGGGLLVPLYIFVMGLSPKHAIPLSKATIFGNAVAIYIFNFKRKHPNNPHAPIIDYAMAAVMEPMTLVGTVIGVMLNKTLPNWLILVLLMLLLAATTYKTAMKGVKVSFPIIHMFRPMKNRLTELCCELCSCGSAKRRSTRPRSSRCCRSHPATPTDGGVAGQSTRCENLQPDVLVE